MIKTALQTHQQFRGSPRNNNHNSYNVSCTSDIEYEQHETNAFANIVIEKSSSSGSDTDYEDAIACGAAEPGFGNDCAVSPDTGSVTINPSGVARSTSIKQSLKDKIKLKRGWQDAHEITNLFKSTKEYSLTAEEQKKIELRKQRNRRSANESRLKRIARERSLEKEVKALVEIQSKLSKEVREQTQLKQDLLKLWQCHLLQCPDSQKRKCELPTPPVTTLVEQMKTKQAISLTQHATTLTEELQVNTSFSLNNPNILAVGSKTNSHDDLFRSEKKILKVCAENDAQCTGANSKLTAFASLRNTVQPLLPSTVINQTSTKVRNCNSTDCLDKVLVNDDSNHAHNIPTYLTHVTEKSNMEQILHEENYDNSIVIYCESDDTCSGLATIHSEVDMTDQKAILSTSCISLKTNKTGFHRQPAKELSNRTQPEHLGCHSIPGDLTAALETNTGEKVTLADILLQPTEADIGDLNDDVMAKRTLHSCRRIDNHFHCHHESLLETPSGYSHFKTGCLDSTISSPIYSVFPSESNQLLNIDHNLASLTNAAEVMSTIETVPKSSTTSDGEHEDLVAGLQNVLNEILQIDQIKIHLFDDFPVKSQC